MYPKLFTPGKIGNLTLKNRAVMEPLAMGVAEPNQTIGEAYFEYLKQRADGGVAMIILENTRVDDQHGVAANCQMSVARDEHIAPLKKAVDMLHSKDVVVFTQLHHPGRETFSNLNSNEPVWSSSSKPCGVCQQETHEMTTEEVELVIDKFAQGARRSKEGGCDGVELHGAHGYLISQFLSPYTNQRKDRFGEDRFTFVKEIIEAIRKTCGEDYPIGMRLTVDELLALNGIKDYFKIEDGIQVCKRLESMKIAYINVSNGIYESFNSLSEPMTYHQGCRTPLIRQIKDNVNVPVIAVNMVKEPWFAEKMLEDNLVDFVGLGRAVVADPNWVKKAQEGKEDDINRCISCTYCFETLVSDTIAGKGPVKCAVNPIAGRETIYNFSNKDGNGRVVAVIGAGLAGMEAARVLAIRGFKPIILEKTSKVGGQINVANKPPEKNKINWIVDYETKQLEKLGVEVRLNTPATKEILQSLNPYAVIVATGAKSIKPSSIKGIDLPNVKTVEEALVLGKALSNLKVCVIGSGVSGLETAEALLENGNTVTVIEMMDKIGGNIYVQHYLDAMDRLSKYDVTYIDSTKLVEVKPKSIVVENVKDFKVSEIEADYIVLAMGIQSLNDTSIADGICDKVFLVGDAKTTGRIESSIRSAFEVAYNLN
ncbi:NADH:flavin oxidoreductase [Candidatus Epulonipiscium fishelsonii]|uniref:NADH:flavin oxidoreductase n=1 Tax=Candidatus Epulonipiscium fishelsonii TaxID=77094 RepID=A0ACC8X9I2_9FIRM|nr:NADH:flavin oxidoreductase [Epulopiscium sp. SCG-B11WGA-EpuloA1]ONI41712.1 NADH:flavin oxidoreductase [Epulopiscium sp. SCG-B05WGA-EpuloA1]